MQKDSSGTQMSLNSVKYNVRVFFGFVFEFVEEYV